MPPTNDTSDDFANTGGGTGALVNVIPHTLPRPSTGLANTAYGAFALGGNTTGAFNTGVGYEALFSTPGGYYNTAVGFHALLSTTTGGINTAVGTYALLSNTTGGGNIAVGFDALYLNTTGGDNIAIGLDALGNNPAGDRNIAIGRRAGRRLTSGSQNIYLGHKGPGGAHTESQTMRLGQKQTRTFIAGITGVQVNGAAVLIDSNGQLGTVLSSARYKRDIHDIGERSQGLFQLRPVTFRYKQDPQGQPQYGLIAEEVAKVYPELVVQGTKGEVESVQYHELIPMLLNELQHQQQEIVELKAQNERLQAALVQQTAALAARLEQLEHAPHGATVAAR